MTQKMKVEIWSDVVCPFCYIGKRKFEEALANFDHANQIEVVWKSFQLDPSQKSNPNISVMEELASKKGWTLEYASDVSESVTDMAAEEGLQFDFSKAVVANTFNAHRLLQFAKTQGKGSALKELLLSGYFTEGKNIDDAATLIELGVLIGLDKTETEKVVDDKMLFAKDVSANIAEARELGINGVPFFVLDRKYGISGAQETKVFTKSLEKAFAEWQTVQPANALETTEGAVCTPEGACD